MSAESASASASVIDAKLAEYEQRIAAQRAALPLSAEQVVALALLRIARILGGTAK